MGRFVLPTGMLLALAAPLAAQKRLPDACKALTLADVTSVLGAGFAHSDATSRLEPADMSSCLYTKGTINLVAISILAAPENDAAAAVRARQESQRKAGRVVTPVGDVCDVAFTVVITASNTTLIAARGPWQVEFQVEHDGAPDAAAERKLAALACPRLK